MEDEHVRGCVCDTMVLIDKLKAAGEFLSRWPSVHFPNTNGELYCELGEGIVEVLEDLRGRLIRLAEEAGEKPGAHAEG